MIASVNNLLIYGSEGKHVLRNFSDDKFSTIQLRLHYVKRLYWILRCKYTTVFSIMQINKEKTL